MRLVLVDVDGTLIAGSSEGLFIGELWRHGRLTPGRLMTALGFALRWAPRFRRHVWKKNKAYLAGLEEAEVAALAERFVAETLRPLVRSPVLRRIDRHRRGGDRVILLSGTLAAIADPLARLVGADGFRATECAMADGRYLAAPPVLHPFHHAKVAVAERLCAEHGVCLAACVALGDSRHDLPLLGRVGEPVAVAPDRELARAATAHGWPILAGDAHDDARALDRPVEQPR